MAGLAGLHQAVHVDAEGLLLERAGEGARSEVLKPGEQRQVQFIAAVPAKQIHAEQHLALCDLLAGRFALEKKKRVIRTDQECNTQSFCWCTWQNSTQHS